MIVIVADPNDGSRGFITKCLVREGHEVLSASTITDAWAFAEVHSPAVLITEVAFRDGDGYAFIEVAMKKAGNKEKLIYLVPDLGGYMMTDSPPMVSKASKAKFQ